MQDNIKIIKDFIKQYNDAAIVLEKSVKIQLESIQNWINNKLSIFNNITQHWASSIRTYEIQEKIAIKVLTKYKWFVSPNMPQDFVFQVIKIWRIKKRKYKEMNKLFIEYFSENNWNNLESMSKIWSQNKLLKKRMGIINSCVQILKRSTHNSNPSNVVIPTLISQIDGFLSDYLHSKDPKGINKKSYYDKKSQFKKSVNLPNLEEITKDFFLNILFQKSMAGKNLEISFSLNRHKIMHGEKTNYGRKDYLVRLFILIDFLACLE